ncbi:MAG: hypothetical protein ABI645_10350 [Pseudomonadota bacterium]
MVERGITDYLVAKRKAAERFGIAEGALLPRNTEIEAALASYQRLFGGEHHASSLQQQRKVALRAMILLEKFAPRLVGAVLSGTATEHSDIQLHVFSDTPEAVYLQLVDKRYEYEVFERKIRMAAERWIMVPSARFQIETETVETFIFQRDGIRQAPLSPVDGKPMRRVEIREARELVLSTSPAE